MKRYKVNSILAIFAFAFLLTLPFNRAKAALSNAHCDVNAIVDNSTGNVLIQGSVAEQNPGQDDSNTSIYLYDDVNSGNSTKYGQESVSDSYTRFFANGPHTAFVDGTSESNPGGGSSTCSKSKNFTVNVPPATGTINVHTNLTTGILISGTSSFSDTVPTNQTFSYPMAPGSYSITADDQIGYTKAITPSLGPLTLNANSSIDWTITYTPISGGGGGGGGGGSAPTVTFSASPTAINAGDSSTLTWSSTNATSCTASNGWSGAKALSGTQSVSPSSYTRYDLTCTGPNGSASAFVEISVDAGLGPAPTVSHPACSDTDYTTTISWPGSVGNVIVYLDKSPRGATDRWFDNGGGGGVTSPVIAPTNFVTRFGSDAPEQHPGVTYFASIQLIGSSNHGPETSWMVPTCPPGTINVTVVPNISTSWQLNGPSSNICNPCSTKTYAADRQAGVYSITNVPTLAGYGAPIVTPAMGVTQTLDPGGTISWTITYQSNPPTITGISNTAAGCGKLKITWTDNSPDENYFQVWRGTVSGGPYSIVADNLYSPSGIAGTGGSGTYTDSPPSNATYYYVVKAVRSSPAQTITSNESSAFNQLCIANLTSSTKVISTVTSGGVTVPYGSNSIIKDGDTVSFKITIHNGGEDATVNYICDTPSANFINLRNMASGGHGTVAGNLATNNVRCPGSTNYYLPVSGAIAKGSADWIVTYDATFQSIGAGALELCSNSADIHFTDVEGGKVKTARIAPTLCNKGSSGTPDIKEVAP